MTKKRATPAGRPAKTKAAAVANAAAVVEVDAAITADAAAESAAGVAIVAPVKAHAIPDTVAVPDAAVAPAVTAEPPAVREPGRDPRTQDPLLWRDDGWTARVIKNIDDDGWAVEMIKDGEAEPALVGPWTMGRDKKNPKPLSAPAFATLVKTASEVIARHEQHLHAMLHKSITVTARSMRVTVTLDIEPDDDDPSALLTAFDEGGERLAQVRVAPNFNLGRGSAAAWVENDFRKPR